MRPFSSASPSFARSPRSTVNFLRGMVLLAALVLMFAALPAAAQAAQSGEWELYGGTSFLWARTSPDLQQLNLSSLHEWGWQTDISEYPWKWFGGTLESSGFYGRPSVYVPANYFGPGLPVNNTTYTDLLAVKSYTMMFGPTFAYRRNPKFQPFGHVLLGGIYRGYSPTSKADPYELLNGQNPNSEKWIFGWALGGGADIAINHLIAIRGQFDWIPSTFKNLVNDRENNLRLTVGLVFRFGGTSPARANLVPPAQDTWSPSGMASNQNQRPLALPNQATQPASRAQQTPPAASMTNAQAPAAANLPTPAVSVPKTPDAPSAVAAASVPTRTMTSQAQAAADQAALMAAHRIPADGGDPEPGGSDTRTTQPQQVAALPTAPAEAMVEFWSRPSGADVEVDGEYVGSTYSTIALTPGEHTITIRKQDFATWQRTIRVTAGNVRVAAYLEQVRATVNFH